MVKEKRGSKILGWIVAEAAFYFSVYYLLYLLNVDKNLWISSLGLFVLINIAILACPVLRKCYK